MVLYLYPYSYISFLFRRIRKVINFIVSKRCGKLGCLVIEACICLFKKKDKYFYFPKLFLFIFMDNLAQLEVHLSLVTIAFLRHLNDIWGQLGAACNYVTKSQCMNVNNGPQTGNVPPRHCSKEQYHLGIFITLHDPQN